MSYTYRTYRYENFHIFAIPEVSIYRKFPKSIKYTVLIQNFQLQYQIRYDIQKDKITYIKYYTEIFIF